jgi:uncharacterized membrane protein
MKFLIHFEGWILILTPIVGVIALITEFSVTHLLLFCVLLIVWKIANNQPNLPV